jgi:hypothetical protein
VTVKGGSKNRTDQELQTTRWFNPAKKIIMIYHYNLRVMMYLVWMAYIVNWQGLTTVSALVCDTTQRPLEITKII